MIYINDIEDAIRNLHWLFADDTKLFGCTNTDPDIEDLQVENVVLDNWSGNWLLKFNVDKCCALCYGYNNPNHTYEKYENGKQKEIVNNKTVKDLGITFDTELKFRKHISNCINKEKRVTGLIRHSFLHITNKYSVNYIKHSLELISNMESSYGTQNLRRILKPLKEFKEEQQN